MAKNNFKLLLEEDEMSLPQAPTMQIERNLKSNIKTFSFLGDIINLYLPRMMDTMVHFVGGDQAGPSSDLMTPHHTHTPDHKNDVAPK